MEHRRTTRLVFPTRLSLYVATPYCLPTKPDRCGFCLFPSEIYRNQEQLDVYLRYLGREGEMYSRFFQEDRPTSVYFGGGTSNLYKARQYDQLLAIVRRMFPRLPPGTEITLEGVPQLFTKEKLGNSFESYLRPGRESRRSEEHKAELQSLTKLVCSLLLEKKILHFI